MIGKLVHYVPSSRTMVLIIPIDLVHREHWIVDKCLRRRFLVICEISLISIGYNLSDLNSRSLPSDIP